MYKTFKILCILVIICHWFSGFGQNSGERQIIFAEPEQIPRFPGGNEALFKYIKENIKYPVKWPKDSITGKVYVTFTIDTSGNVINPKILRGLNPTLDTIALKLFWEMPKWYPARNGNKPIEYQYNLPIRFGEALKAAQEK